MNRVLAVEDEPRFASFLAKGLRANGFTPTVVDDGERASAIASDDNFDLMLLDVGLPRKDGFAVLADIRRRGQRLPVIMLTMRDDLADKVHGLTHGADDYITKPFEFEELLARIHARLRRKASAEDQLVHSVGSVTLDTRSRRASIAGRSVDLTARQFTMLEVLVRHPDQVLSREQLLSHVWGYDFDPGSNIVDVYVRRLREKLAPDVIETVRGIGYRLRA
jgi:two-component system, OmpR family, copper resistance phosphate regulon response regulator CusR